jgi:hypothetical protein
VLQAQLVHRVHKVPLVLQDPQDHKDHKVLLVQLVQQDQVELEQATLVLQEMNLLEMETQQHSC